MFRFLLMILLIFSSQLFAKDPLQGKTFSSCENISNHTEIEYTVEYMPRNEEFEAELYIGKGKRPCGGQRLFAIGRIWDYKVNHNELITTLESVKVIILDLSVVKMFNKNEICGVKNWKVHEVVSCEGKEILDIEDNVGHRTIHKFKLQGKKMIVTDDDGESSELIQKK